MNSNLADRVLARFNLASPPPVSPAGADALFAAWCANVSFDNVLKRIALHENAATLPGMTSSSFFEDYLATGAGGTCWSTSGALCDLYRALGFRTERVGAVMRPDMNGPPPGGNAAGHGSVIVDVDGARFLADASILCGTLIELRRNEVTRAGTALTPVTATPHDGLWHIQFRSGHAETPGFCQLLALGVDDAFFRARHEASRTESGFNARLMARKNKPHANEVVVLRGGTRYVRTMNGIEATPIEDRVDAVVRDMGIDRSVALRIPPDQVP